MDAPKDLNHCVIFEEVHKLGDMVLISLTAAVRHFNLVFSMNKVVLKQKHQTFLGGANLGVKFMRHHHD